MSEATLRILNRSLRHAQKSPEWYAARYNILTSSDVASALHANQYMSAEQLLNIKCAPLVTDDSSESNTAMAWGNKFESVARDIFTQLPEQAFITAHEKTHPSTYVTGENKAVLECGLVISETHDWLGASPDGILVNGKLLEIKCPVRRSIATNSIPHHYWIQMQIQMAVCDVNETYFLQCKFKKNPTNLAAYEYSGQLADCTWGLKKYTLDVVRRDSDWFAEKLPAMHAFWKQVLRYRQTGFANLSSDIRQTVPYYTSVACSSGRPDNIAQQTPSLSALQQNMSPKLAPLAIHAQMREFDSEWVYATATRNYVRQDPILDWLDLYYGKDRDAPKFSLDATPRALPASSINNSDDFFQYIKAKGLEFEKQVVQRIRDQYPNDIKTCASSCQARSIARYEETVELMRTGCPIIYQAVLHNSVDKIYGVADFLVRSDMINRLFVKPVLDADDEQIGCKFSESWHYVVLDIKNSKIQLAADATHILNSGSAPAYKTQLWLYTQAVAVIQDYNPMKSFVMGNQYEYMKKSITYTDNRWFYTAGVIDYAARDKSYVSMAQKAVDWCRSVRQSGKNWTINPPSCEELYPNMKNTMDSPWHTVKNNIAQDIGEITLLWNCGVNNRKKAHDAGITSWKDPRLTAKLMGINGKKTQPIVDAFIQTNQGSANWQPAHIEHRLPRYRVEIFIDFETVNSSAEHISKNSTTEERFVFMIGFGWRINDGNPAQWSYENFTCPHVQHNGTIERDNFVAFHERLFSILDQHNATQDYMMYHWSQAERWIYDDLAQRYKKDIAPIEYMLCVDKHWFDLHYLFKSENLIIRGTFGFGLKSIAKQLFQLGYIQTEWPDSSVVDGLNAMIKAVECSDEAIALSCHMKELPIMQDIIQYNEVDCRVLLEILSFLRHNVIREKRKMSTRDAKKTHDKQPARKKIRASS